MADRVFEFKRWLSEARPGHVYSYYTGHLAVDREYNVFEAATVTYSDEIAEIDKLAREVLKAFYADKVYLFQRKLGDHRYEYIAMRRYRGGPNW